MNAVNVAVMALNRVGMEAVRVTHLIAQMQAVLHTMFTVMASSSSVD